MQEAKKKSSPSELLHVATLAQEVCVFMSLIYMDVKFVSRLS